MEGSSSSPPSYTMPSSSSLVSELFGSRDSSSPTAIFESVFKPSSVQVLEREILGSEVTDKKPEHETQIASDKIGSAEAESLVKQEKDMNLIYQEQRGQPSHLCSSIFYGGQDFYSHSQTTQNSGFDLQAKKDSSEDNSGIASIGNWWEGSLYY